MTSFVIGGSFLYVGTVGKEEDLIRGPTCPLTNPQISVPDVDGTYCRQSTRRDSLEESVVCRTLHSVW